MKTIKYVRYIGGVVFTLGILLILLPFLYYVFNIEKDESTVETEHKKVTITDTVRVKVEVIDTLKTKVILTDTIRREVIVPLRDSVQ